MTDTMKKYFEDEYRTNYDMDKEEHFYIRGDKNDYRVVKTTMDVYDEQYDETGIESVGMGACVSVHEITDHNPDALKSLKTLFPDYEWEYYEDVIYNSYIATRGAISTMIYTYPEDVDNLVNNMLCVLEKIA